MGGVVTIIIVITGIREELQIYCSFSDNTISVSVNRTIRRKRGRLSHAAQEFKGQGSIIRL